MKNEELISTREKLIAISCQVDLPITFFVRDFDDR